MAIDLISYKDFLVVVTQNGNLEVYKDYQLLRNFDNLGLMTTYNPSPGVQYAEYNRILQSIDTGLIFFVVQGKHNQIAYIDLEEEKIQSKALPSIRLDNINCFSVHQLGLPGLLLTEAEISVQQQVHTQHNLM